MQRKERVRVLLVEDEVADARLACLGLPEDGYDVHHVRTGHAALDAAAHDIYDVVLLDHRLPDLSGVELGRRLRASGFGGALVMLSGVHQDALVAQAFEAGVQDFVVKDLSYGARLSDAVQSAVGA